MSRPRFVFRFEPANRFSLAALFGSLEVDGIRGRVDLVVAPSQKASVKALGAGGQAFLFHSLTSPEAWRFGQELARVREIVARPFLAVAGGPHVTGDTASVFDLGYDVAFAGRAERSFARFAREVLGGVVPPAGSVIPEVPDPAWEETLFVSSVSGFFPVLEIQRGCNVKCSFCQAGRQSGESARFKSLDAVREFLRRLYARGLTRAYFLTPSAFDYRPAGCADSLAGVEALLAICREEKMRFVEYGIFPSEIRPAKETAPFFATVKALASNRRTVIGAQSFSPRILRLARRGHGVGEIVSTVKAASDAGFRPYVDVMFGLPGETAEDRRMTCDALEALFFSDGARMQLHHYVPLAGTPWYHEDPEPLDDAAIRRIVRMEKAGMTRGWWREGPALARAVALVRGALKR
ncbi:MAG: radical SAM protein [Deltaproteobacteria bacterium]|nr:radical SAM protein [Deltaproteobacteria bacterium]